MYPFGYASVYKVTYLFPSDDRRVKCIGNFLRNSKLRLVGQMLWLWHRYCAPFLQSHDQGATTARKEEVIVVRKHGSASMGSFLLKNEMSRSLAVLP